MIPAILIVLGAIVCIGVGAAIAFAVILGGIQRSIGRGLGW